MVIYNMFCKKLLAIIFLAVLIGLIGIPPVFAETKKEPEPPFQCWPQNECGTKGGKWAQTADSKTKCPAKFDGKDLGYCYAPAPNVNLQIKIGSESVVKDLANYIPLIYNYLVSIVSIVAVIMIMVGGLRYLTAGGNPSAITSAKETIIGAVIGLFLTFGSYLLLQTINPALVQLKIPDIKMVRTEILKPAPLTKGGECYTIRDKASCAATCPGCECHPVCTPDIDKLLLAAGGLMIGAPLLAGCSVAAPCLSAASSVGKFALKAGGKIAKAAIYFAVNHPVLTAGAVYWAVAGPNDGEKGVCYGAPQNSINDWGLCDSEKECKTGSKCVVVSKSGSSSGGEVCGLKMCSNGESGRPCNTSKGDEDCKKTLGFKCFQTAILTDMGVCGKDDDRPAFAECDKNEQCQTGYCDGYCSLPAAGGQLKGLQCQTSNPDCGISGWEGPGICSSYSGISNATGASVETVKEIAGSPPTAAQCNDKCKKCFSRTIWLTCSGKSTGEIIGKCYKTPLQSCSSQTDCIFTCEQGKCSDWPPPECNGFLPTDSKCSSP